jgi:hypothetical protein
MLEFLFSAQLQLNSVIFVGSLWDGFSEFWDKRLIVKFKEPLVYDLVRRAHDAGVHGGA